MIHSGSIPEHNNIFLQEILYHGIKLPENLIWQVKN